MSKILGCITARGGSKRIPHKNLYPVAGLPLIHYAAYAAKSSDIFNRIILSTDSEKIAHAVKDIGVEVPFMRPKELAEDTTSSFEVVRHALESLPEKYDYTALIHPTSPLIQNWHWQEALELLLAEEGDSVIGVRPIPSKYHPSKALQGSPCLITKERRQGIRIQDLGESWYATGGIYIFRTSNIKNGDFYGEKIIPYEIDEDYELDINEIEDIDEARERICLIMPPSVKEDDERAYKRLCEENESK